MSRALLLVAIFGAAACATPTDDETDGVSSPSALASDDYRTYAALATQGGAAPALGSVTVLGLRGLAIDGTTHATHYGHAFDDTLVVLGADGSATRLAASTHPFELAGVAGVPDADGDGIADVGMIRPGVYDVTSRDRTIAGKASFDVNQHGQGKLPGWRDTNHDGILSDDERAASERRNDVLTDVLFHQGDGDAPAVVGCQVLSAAVIDGFITAIGGAHAHFRYVLVDMTDADAPDASTLPR